MPNQDHEQERRLSLRKNRRQVFWNKATYLADRAVARHNLSNTLNAADVCQVANGIGQGRWRAISYQDGALKILAQDYEVIAQIKLRELQLITAINTELKSPQVKKLLVQLQWGDESASLQP